jgi:hypothetical protein
MKPTPAQRCADAVLAFFIGLMGALMLVHELAK